MRGGCLDILPKRDVYFKAGLTARKVLEKEPENEIALHEIVEDFGTQVITYGHWDVKEALMDLELADMKSTDINAIVELVLKRSCKGDFK